MVGVTGQGVPAAFCWLSYSEGTGRRQPHGRKCRQEEGEQVKVRASVGVMEKISNKLRKKSWFSR